MKKYEILDMEIEILDPSDVIATSSTVTTGIVQFPWAESGAASSAAYEVMNVDVLESETVSKFDI